MTEFGANGQRSLPSLQNEIIKKNALIQKPHFDILTVER